MSVSERIKELREAAGLSQDELARKIEMSRISIGNYERGIRTPDAKNIKKIADYFNVTTDYLIGSSDTKRLEDDNINKRLGLTDKAINMLEEIHKGNPGNSLTRTINTLIENASVLWEIGRFLYYDLDIDSSDVYGSEDSGISLMPYPLVYRYKNESIVTDLAPPVDPDTMLEVITDETWRKIALLKIQDRLNQMYMEVSNECPPKEQPAEPEQSEKRQ